jgi:bifunctional DNA-binding transcriptional regulator/antitoxin component of YhaV-PrlF toxin-antitoxin module
MQRNKMKQIICFVNDDEKEVFKEKLSSADSRRFLLSSSRDSGYLR